MLMLISRLSSINSIYIINHLSTKINLIKSTRNYSNSIEKEDQQQQQQPLPLPKAERNPAHTSKLPLPPSKSPPPIAHATIQSIDHDYDVNLNQINHEQEVQEMRLKFITLQSELETIKAERNVLATTESLPPSPDLQSHLTTNSTREPRDTKRPVGAFRGGLIGFLMGLSMVGGYGYVSLLDDYKTASGLLLASVEELKSSTQTITTHIKRIERVEEALNELIKNAAMKKDVEASRNEFKKLTESSHVDLLNLKAHVWGVEQDLNTLTKAKAIRI